MIRISTEVGWTAEGRPETAPAAGERVLLLVEENQTGQRCWRLAQFTTSRHEDGSPTGMWISTDGVLIAVGYAGNDITLALGWMPCPPTEFMDDEPPILRWTVPGYLSETVMRSVSRADGDTITLYWVPNLPGFSMIPLAIHQPPEAMLVQLQDKDCLLQARRLEIRILP